MSVMPSRFGIKIYTKELFLDKDTVIMEVSGKISLFRNLTIEKVES